MPRRKAGILSSTLSKLSENVRDIEAQRIPHARFWDEWNRTALKSDGPLWVALGDSSTQGVGAVDPMNGWVPEILNRLRTHTDSNWRVVNLAITGAQFGDVAEFQVPRLNELRAAGHTVRLATLIAGANNLMAPVSWARSLGHLQTVLDGLPPRRSVVARVGVSSPLNSLMARRFNARIKRAHLEHGFELFWPWDWPSRDGLAGDNFHPNERGYEYMADLIWPAIERVVGR